MLIRVNRQVRELYVVVFDSRKLVKVLELLEHFYVRAKGLDRGVKKVYGVVLLDSEGRRYLLDNDVQIEGHVINIDDYGLEKGVAMAVVYAKVLYVKPIRRVIAGVDYGRSVGVAVVVNDDVVYTRSYSAVDGALNDIKFLMKNIDAELKIVRVGMVQDFDEAFMGKIIEVLKDVASVELVPEHGSSKRRLLLEKAKLKADEIAAINIALYRNTAYKSEANTKLLRHA